MHRLYEAKVDGERWSILEISKENYHTYRLIDRKEKERYYLIGIIGVEQVGEDEFLVYKKSYDNKFEISRQKVHNADFKELFIKRFSKFEFINDDTIMFSDWLKHGGYSCSGFYSIKENKMLEEGKWLVGKSIETYEDDSNKKQLYVEDEIAFTDKLLLYTVDSDTLEPNSDCYSETRNSYIKISSKEDLLKIYEEDKNQNMKMEKDMVQQRCEKLKHAKELIKKINKKFLY